MSYRLAASCIKDVAITINGRITNTMIIRIVVSAAALGLCRIDPDNRRNIGANTMAITVPQRIAPKNGHKIQAKASEAVTRSNRKVFSSSLYILIFFQFAHIDYESR